MVFSQSNPIGSDFIPNIRKSLSQKACSRKSHILWKTCSKKYLIYFENCQIDNLELIPKTFTKGKMVILKVMRL